MNGSYLDVEISADDFGRSAEANAGILMAFEQGLVSSASIMSNMPEFKEACSLLSSNQQITNIGIHLNITEGEPLTEAIRQFSVFCDKHGRFMATKLKAFRPFRQVEKKELWNELDAQIRQCHDVGIYPHRIDSHMHRHTNWLVGKMVIQLAKKHHIPAVRLAGNCRRQNFGKQLFTRAYNYRLRLHGLAGHDYFGAVDDLCRCRDRLQGKIEVMVHPVLDADGVLRDAESMRPLSDHLSWFLNHQRKPYEQ